MAEKKEPERRELEEAEGRVAQVEPVCPEHPEEDGEHERRVEVVAVRPLAGCIFGKVATVGLPAKLEFQSDP